MRIVAIGGCSGAGKTHLANALARTIGACSALSLDSYYLPLPDLTLDERALRNYDHPDSLEWTLLETHMQALRRGEAVEIPVYLFDQHTRAEVTERIEPSGVLLVEGILALHRAEIRKLADVRVFVETQATACFTRRLARDVAERGRSEESVRMQYRDSVWPMAEEFVLPSRAHADLIVDGAAAVNAAVQEILTRLEGVR